MLRRLMMAASSIVAYYWNPLDKSANITLSSLDKLATRNVLADAWFLVRGVTDRSTGKYYFEVVNNNSIVPGLMVGASNSALGLSTYPGSSLLSFGFHANASGSETYNNGVGANSGGSTVGAGSYARVAIDFDTGKIWLGPSGSWEGGGDPSAGTTPTYSFTANTPLFPALGLYKSNQSATLRVLSSEFGGTVPTGFSAWS